MRRLRRKRYRQYWVYGILYVVCASSGIDEPSRKEDKVVSFCGGAFMAQFGKPSPLSIPQWEAHLGGLQQGASDDHSESFEVVSGPF
jgi:hypothetical protein